MEIHRQIKPITIENATVDYKNLTKNKSAGNKATDFFFFKYRLDTEAKTGLTFHTWLERGMKPCEISLLAKKMQTYKSEINAKYDIFLLYHGSISNFKASIAQKLYQQFGAKTVLDFCAGWGGRCLGAMSCNIDYIGFDTNINLQEPYSQMVSAYPTKSKVIMEFIDSSLVDFSKYSYDFVFTSPPFFRGKKLIEVYDNMPTYKNRKHFNESFLFIVLKNVFLHLKINGYLALNIPKQMLTDVVSCLGPPSVILPMSYKKRCSEIDYKECIYVWQK